MAQEENPLLPETRGTRTLVISVGGLSALLGLTVLVGWNPNNLHLIQFTSTSAFPIYNIALSFLLCSGGLLAVATALEQKVRHRMKLLNESNQVLVREIAQHRQVTEEALQK